MPPVAGRAAGPQRSVPLLRQHRLVPQEAARGDCSWTGQVRAEIPVGSNNFIAHIFPPTITFFLLHILFFQYLLVHNFQYIHQT